MAHRPQTPRTSRGQFGGTLLMQLVAQGDLLPMRIPGLRALAQRSGATLESILIRRQLVTENALARAHAEIAKVPVANLHDHPPDPRLIDAFGADRAIRMCVTPWKQLGQTTLIAAASPQAFDRALPHLQGLFPHMRLTIAPQTQIIAAVTRLRRQSLIKRAEALPPDVASCRSLRIPGWPMMGLVAGSALLALVLAAPALVFGLFTAWAVLTLCAVAALKLTCGVLFWRRDGAPKRLDTKALRTARLPEMSILVPLYKEREIAGHLVQRLRRLNYPRERLDVILITEADDATTRETLAQTQLPRWMRVVEVPSGTVKTKPRAMNYALDHCRGTIIGVYDAEDAPEPDQLLKVAAGFATAPPDVVCLQGILDFYNPCANWMARCFTMEYAAWFRLMLPGLQDLKLPIPLGGTTIFFRRAALEELKGWDAHNVTEDADLGMRLTRHGYRTQLIPTVTFEEANCRPWPWIKQRSRWLKGYAITYAVHMRNPRALWRDLGPRGFWGVQLLFAATLSQFLLAPVLWSFWLLLLGLWHPLDGALGQTGIWTLTAFFLSCELVSIGVTSSALSRTANRRLIPWVPSLHIYFMLGALAAYKGFYELFGSPFYWDKTSHGHSNPTSARLTLLRRRVSGALQRPG